MAYKILSAHNQSGNDNKVNVKFDEITSHDITYVGIIQTAKASGLKEFPLPYTLTNCHNSLCAVGGTINEDDHAFGLSAAKKYGAIAGAYILFNLSGKESLNTRAISRSSRGTDMIPSRMFS